MPRISKRIQEKGTCVTRKKNSNPPVKVDESLRWSLKEKQLLLESIQEHGLADLKALQADVKNRTVAEIERFLNQRRVRLSVEYNRQKQKEAEASGTSLNHSIIKWCAKMREAIDIKYRGTDYSVVLQEVLETAAKEESDMAPTEDEPNFGLIYMYLSRVVAGYIPPSLPPVESWIMLHAWQSLTETFKNNDWDEEKEFLKSLHLRKFAPLEPEFRKMSKEQHWKILRDSQKNGELSDLKEAIGSSSTASSAYQEPSCSEQSANETSEKYPLWNLSEHYYPALLASLNPLTVPVSMLDKETEIVFGKNV